MAQNKLKQNNSEETIVSPQLAWLAGAATRLVDGLHKEHVASSALQAVHRVVVLLDIGHNHPAVQRVTQVYKHTHTHTDEVNEETARNLYFVL